MKKLVFIIAAVTISACATKSNVKSDGTTDEPKFPKPYSVTFNNNRGTFPTWDELANVKAGMTKDELYKLLGRPHYDEGMFGVREWDYLFHFHTPGQGTDNVTTCQFKVIYDKNKFTRSFFWRSVDPETAVCPPTPRTPQMQKYTLNADALFAFDKSGEGDMLPAGKAQLDELARELQKYQSLNAVRIIGHTDRLGSHEYNKGLSERRAETVRRYLVARGVPAGIMSSVGVGKTQQIHECSNNLPRRELIACLQPNRRVEVEIEGSGVISGADGAYQQGGTSGITETTPQALPGEPNDFLKQRK